MSSLGLGNSALWYRADLVERLARQARELVLFPRPNLRAQLRELTGIEKAIMAYYQSWESWRELSLHPECSSLYKDTYCHYVADKGMIPVDGMGASVKRYEKLIPSFIRPMSL